MKIRYGLRTACGLAVVAAILLVFQVSTRGGLNILDPVKPYALELTASGGNGSFIVNPHGVINGTQYRVTNPGSRHATGTGSAQHAAAEVRHIGFVKIHKAASSTMQNMFFRFGLKRNLTFVFTQHPNYFSRDVKGHLPLVPPKYRTSYDILCNHGVFDYKIYSEILPADTVYLGIVRDPLEVFISAVNFYTQKSQLLSYLAKVPGNKVQNLIKHSARYDPAFFSYTKNVMARDFGFPQSTNIGAINSKLSELDSTIKLVLLVEYFEESLILMKRYLHWSLRDIVFIKNNVFSKSGWSISDLTPSDIDMFQSRNKLDYIVYQFFYDKFWKQFRSEGDDIHTEVLNFKQVLEKVYAFCNEKNAILSKAIGRLTIAQTDWNEAFYVSIDDCAYMKKDELDFISTLRHKQGSELRGRGRRDANKGKELRG